MLQSKEDLSNSRGNIQISIFASTSRQRPESRRRHEEYFILLKGRSQDDWAVFSVSPPLQVPLPSDCRFRCRRAGLESPYLPWHVGMIVSRNFQKMRCSRSRTLCRTTVFATYYNTKLANKDHLHQGQVNRHRRKRVSHQYPMPSCRTTPFARPIRLISGSYPDVNASAKSTSLEMS